jgi:sugar-phosphatase
LSFEQLMRFTGGDEQNISLFEQPPSTLLHTSLTARVEGEGGKRVRDRKSPAGMRVVDRTLRNEHRHVGIVEVVSSYRYGGIHDDIMSQNRPGHQLCVAARFTTLGSAGAVIRFRPLLIQSCRSVDPARRIVEANRLMKDLGCFSALLFDMDGTILSSIAAAERVWGAWAKRHGIDVETFLPTIHGMRAVETIARLRMPGIDPQAEADALTLAEMDDMEGIEAIAGAVKFLSSLPLDRWAIVTSAPRALAMRRMEAAGLPMPSVLVTADDVSKGKPAPDCYLLAADRLGQRAQDCLVFEDAAAGIEAAEAAGASVMVVTATHKHPLKSSHARIAAYDELVADVAQEGGLRLSRESFRMSLRAEST